MIRHVVMSFIWGLVALFAVACIVTTVSSWGHIGECEVLLKNFIHVYTWKTFLIMWAIAGAIITYLFSDSGL